MGLQWVQQNIESFGGDPGNITLFGNSAGGFSIGLHLLSSQSADLFHRAILQSGTPLLPGGILTSSDGKSNSLNLALKVAGCSKSDDMSVIARCMKNLRADVLQNILPSSQFMALLTIDGNFLTDDPAELLKTGKFKKCPHHDRKWSERGVIFHSVLLPEIFEFDICYYDPRSVPGKP